MDSWSRADITAKIILGVAGLALSIVLALDQVQDRHRQTIDREAEQVRKADETRQAREDGLKREFQAYYQLARAAKADDAAARSDLDLASTLAQTLAARPFRQGFYLDSIVALRARLEPAAPRTAGSVAQAPVTLQAREATPDDSAPAADARWFAVIGSYPITPAGRAQADAQARAAAAAGGGCAEIWSTRISRNYAVVLGGIGTRSAALVNAQRARSSGIADDAFTQADRGWSRVAPCAAP